MVGILQNNRYGGPHPHVPERHQFGQHRRGERPHLCRWFTSTQHSRNRRKCPQQPFKKMFLRQLMKWLRSQKNMSGTPFCLDRWHIECTPSLQGTREIRSTVITTPTVSLKGSDWMTEREATDKINAYITKHMFKEKDKKMTTRIVALLAEGNPGQRYFFGIGFAHLVVLKNIMKILACRNIFYMLSSTIVRWECKSTMDYFDEHLITITQFKILIHCNQDGMGTTVTVMNKI